MTTPADIRRNLERRFDRDESNRLARLIHKKIVRSRDSECEIWDGDFHKPTTRCLFRDHESGHVMEVKRWVTGIEIPENMYPVWAVTCGVNRCVRPEHNYAAKFEPIFPKRKRV